MEEQHSDRGQTEILFLHELIVEQNILTESNLSVAVNVKQIESDLKQRIGKTENCFKRLKFGPRN